MENHHHAPQTEEQFLGKPLVSAAKFRPVLNRPYLAKNLLLESQVSLLVGPPNIGKSSVVAALAASISTGHALGKMPIKRAAVLYVAAEDPNGIAERAFGYFQNEAADVADFEIYGWPVDLSDELEMEGFAREAVKFVKRKGADRLLIVFDTLNLCIGDSDENSARDMGRVVGHAQMLARMTRAHIMIVHHTSVADNGRPRGSTAMHGNIDTMLVLRKVEGQGDETLVLLTQEKQRSVRKGKPLLFEVGALVAGEDDDGEKITVPIARPAEITSSLIAEFATKGKSGGEADARAAEVMRVLAALHAKSPAIYHEARALSKMVGEGFEGVRSNPDSLRKAVRRALDTLIDAGKAETDGNGGYRASCSAEERPETKATSLH